MPDLQSDGDQAVGAKPSDTMRMRGRIDQELNELVAMLPRLEVDLTAAEEQSVQADVIRRDVAANPNRFSPQERLQILERSQDLGVRRANLEVMLEAARERVALLEDVRAALAHSRPAARDAGAGVPSIEVYNAIEAERLRMARELHDGPAQVLSNLVLEADILERLLTRDPSQVPAQLQEFKNSVRNAVADMRRFLFELRPMALDDLGLIATMRRFVSEYQDRTGIVCRFNLTGEERRLDGDLEAALYRIIQEALTNVQRHSRARTVEIALDVQRDRIALRVRDDGLGFDPKAPRPGGPPQFGVMGMRERATGVGGSLDVVSEEGRGTEVVAEFPALGPAATKPPSDQA